MRYSAIFPHFLALALLLSGAEAAQRVEQQALAVQPGCTVRVDAYRGQINVVTGGSDEVRVSVALELPETKPGQARAVLDAFTLTSEATEYEVRFTARNARDRDVRFAWEDSMRPQMVFTVTVLPFSVCKLSFHIDQHAFTQNFCSFGKTSPHN